MTFTRFFSVVSGNIDCIMITVQFFAFEFQLWIEVLAPLPKHPSHCLYNWNEPLSWERIWGKSPLLSTVNHSPALKHPRFLVVQRCWAWTSPHLWDYVAVVGGSVLCPPSLSARRPWGAEAPAAVLPSVRREGLALVERARPCLIWWRGCSWSSNGRLVLN